jgi:hypothetical protein
VGDGVNVPGENGSTDQEPVEEVESDLEAIKAALDELDAGDRGLPIDEAFAAIRRRLGLE